MTNEWIQERTTEGMEWNGQWNGMKKEWMDQMEGTPMEWTITHRHLNGVRTKVNGGENLSKQRPAVFIFNHRNNFDL